MDINNRKVINNFWNGLSLPPLITTTQENIAVDLQVSKNNNYNSIGDSLLYFSLSVKDVITTPTYMDESEINVKISDATMDKFTE